MATGELLRCYAEDILNVAPGVQTNSSLTTRPLDIDGVAPRIEHRA